MNNIPLPPPIRFPNPNIGPTQSIALPTFIPPTWQPVPIYREQIPELNPPRVGPKPEEEEEEEEETKQEQAETNPATDLIPDIPLPVIPESAMVNQVTIPIVNIDVPLPKPEILTIAITTAGVAAIASVGGTMVAGNLFRQLIKIFKPLFKTVLKKLMKARGKEMKSWARMRSEPRQRIARKRGMTDGS